MRRLFINVFEVIMGLNNILNGLRLLMDVCESYNDARWTNQRKLKQSNSSVMMDPSMTRYALNYLYFARDELPMWYYRKVSIVALKLWFYDAKNNHRVDSVVKWSKIIEEDRWAGRTLHLGFQWACWACPVRIRGFDSSKLSMFNKLRLLQWWYRFCYAQWPLFVVDGRTVLAF